MKHISLSILIPAYNDEHTIFRVVTRAIQAARTVTPVFEIVVVNDASPDRLSSVLAALKRTVPELRIITHTKNQGYGGTLKDLYYAGKYEWLFTVPGDNQIDPMEIKKLAVHMHHADMIIGWRTKRHDSMARKRQSVVYNGLLRLLFGLSLHDINSVRLMRREIMKGRVLQGNSAFIDAQLTIGALRDGFTVMECPILHKARLTTGASGGKPRIIIPVIVDMIRYKLLHIL